MGLCDDFLVKYSGKPVRKDGNMDLFRHEAVRYVYDVSGFNSVLVLCF